MKGETKDNKKSHMDFGKELDLFIVNETVGRGLPLLTPKGATIKRILTRFIEDEEIKRGYEYTSTPVLAKSELYKISGHYEHYKDSMFIFDAGDEEMVLRPMTCPHQFMIYKSRPRSYRELPIRYAEVANLFRNEQSGEMHGLIRVRQFSLADAHIICAPEQLEKEFEGVLELIQYVMNCLGLTEYWYRFSKWDPENKKKYINNTDAWEKSQQMMKKIIDKTNLKYEEAEGEAAFYGPKLDIQMKNVFGKEDTIFTVQIDFALPEKFDMTYEGADGKKHRPMIIHRSAIGCLERTIAMLLEHHQGALPLWLSPVQTTVLPISEKFEQYAKTIIKTLKTGNIRCEINTSNETLGKRIREAEMQKIPYILVVGEKEEKAGTIAARPRHGETEEMKIEKFMEKIKKENDSHQ